jgi:hypothetical protein
VELNLKAPVRAERNKKQESLEVKSFTLDFPPKAKDSILQDCATALLQNCYQRRPGVLRVQA